MLGYGHPLDDSLFEMASALGTVGLSVGVTAADAPAPLLLVQTLAMLLGRLELLVVLTSCAKVARDVATVASRRRS
jgi:trk system potassium uptake protein TrkH